MVRQKRLIAGLVAAFGLFALRGGATLPSRTAQQILESADRTRNGWDEFVVDIEITNYRGETADDVSRYQVFIKGTDKNLVKFEDPKDRGKYLLTLDGAMWLYLPSASRPIRITPLQRLSGNASNGDVAQTSFAANYDAVLSGEEEVDGQRAYVLELTAKTKSSTYRSIRYWIAKETSLPLKAELRMGSGKVSKVATFDRYEKVGGRMLLRRQVIIDALRKGQKTVLVFGKYTPREIPDRMFNANYLGQL